MNIDFNNDWIDKNKNFISLSKIIEMITPKFDKEGVAEKTKNKHYNNKDSQYYHKNVDEIIQIWEDKGQTSMKYGRLLDSYIGLTYESNDVDTDIELWKLDNNYDDDIRLKGLCESFNNCKNDFLDKLQYVNREVTVYYELDDYYITGRLDALFYNPNNNNYCIIDWKSSNSIDKIKTKWTENLLGPASIYPNLNWYTYTLQTFFYKTALLNHYIKDIEENNIKTLVIDLPGHKVDDKFYEICTPAFKYNKEFIDKVFSFAIKKNKLLNKQ